MPETKVEAVKAPPVQVRENYVNNKEFSQAVVDYVKSVNDAKAAGSPIPRIPNYIGSCFLKISTGLSRRPNFSRYTYRDEMVSDAVQNCVTAIMNFKLDAVTRSGNPNAFAYFTQITWYAFLRRIALEKKQQDIKEKIIDECGIDEFAEGGDESMIEAVKTKRLRFADDPVIVSAPLKSPRKPATRKSVPTSSVSLSEFTA